MWGRAWGGLVISSGRLPGGDKHAEEEVIRRGNGPCVEVGKMEGQSNFGSIDPITDHQESCHLSLPVH